MEYMSRVRLAWRVAPYAGAWIEISLLYSPTPSRNVAPYAGAWIEISPCTPRKATAAVAPYAGAWIEMSHAYS